jgi:hypothetical protein
MPWYVDDRNSRRVRRAQLRAPATAPRHRLASCIEEALRLAVLPGESEGRVYYFRRIRIAGLPADGDRRAWLNLFQRTLTEAAATAIHGADRRAEAAAAVFFLSRQEALEVLLRRVLAHRAPGEWFWPAVLKGSDPGPVADAGVAAVLEALRRTPAGWSAVAAALFGSPGPAIDPVDLLEAIPAAVAQAWVAEIDGGRPLPAHARPANLPFAQAALRTVLRTFGLASPRTEWFAAMALLRESPADLAAGILVERARLGLRQMLPQSGFVSSKPEDSRAGPASGAEIGFVLSNWQKGPTNQLTTADPALRRSEPVPGWLEGAPTTAAGLFFLLNVLARIGMPEAIAAGLPAAIPDFLPRLLLSLARLAAVPDTDPVVGWLEAQLGTNRVRFAIPCPPGWWPANQRVSRETEVPERLVRFWAVAVRRWCLRMGKISVREVVNRPGLFSVNRTDLDVSLPLDEAEIRIRRVGLDLDPGWLPWFGWVVRFHYSYRGRLDA